MHIEEGMLVNIHTRQEEGLALPVQMNGHTVNKSYAVSNISITDDVHVCHPLQKLQLLTQINIDNVLSSLTTATGGTIHTVVQASTTTLLLLVVAISNLF